MTLVRRTFHPSIDIIPRCNSHADIAAVASVTRCQPRNPVPTSSFRTTSPVSPPLDSQACCIPLPILGFVAFQLVFALGVLRHPAPAVIAHGLYAAEHAIDGLLATLFVPLEGFPTCSRGVSPRSLPP